MFDDGLRVALADFIAGILNLQATVVVEKFTHERRAVTYSPVKSPSVSPQCSRLD